MVLVVIGLLCFVSVPQFYTMRSAHRRSEANNTIERLRIALASANSKSNERTITIESLDDEPAGKPCVACFTIAYDKGLKDHLWFKVSNLEYIYAINNNPENVSAYSSRGNLKLKFDRNSHQILIEEIK